MSFEPIKDVDGKDVELDSLVTEAATQLVTERRHSATTLIKNFLMKAEGLTDEVKRARKELEKKEESLAKTNEKISRLRKGDWSVLSENNSASHPDSERK